ncbi:MAG: ATP-dependent helicase HrpB [Hyphomicrobiaceae bacterium]|nr:ATP-dependent helicase HrpB [Hyphomicrobiaceae bacterium]
MAPPGNLPVLDALPALGEALAGGTSAVLVAPPGAGKTTGVPTALLDQPWLAGRKILLLEPRRIAARAAAERMAEMLGERVGETVGIRARLDTRVSARTRIEVVTEGVFTRLILGDPELGGVGLVIFDEFHERSLDADLGLALALDARAGLRDELRILVMSATLDGARVASLLGRETPVISSNGRAYPVETRYLGRPPERTSIADAVAVAVRRALAEEPGSLLAFLPGQGEIRRAAERLRDDSRTPGVDIVELHGGLDGKAQREAIRPPAGRRKVVLATAIAQTSITIEGVRIVVDSGLERLPRYDAGAGVTRLETVRASRATVDQRRGRAGRTEPGVCYRLWSEPETQGLLAFTAPEMLAADLSALVLDCAAWGVTEPRTLAWLDPPPPGALAAARDELRSLAAIDAGGRLTDAGRRLRDLPLSPRLAHMVLAAAERGLAFEAAQVAAVLSERGAGGLSPDVEERLQGLRRERGPRADGLRRMAQDWAQAADRLSPKRSGAAASPSPSAAALLALAFPDRIARARGTRGTFLLANGRAGQVDAASPLADAPFLVVAEMSGVAAASRVLLAARLDESDLVHVAGDRIETCEETVFDTQAASLRARLERRLGAIVLSSEPRPVPGDEVAAAALAAGIAGLGVGRLPWTRFQRQLRDRVAFVRKARPDAERSDWPDLSDSGLAATVSDWLAPFIVGATRLADIGADHLGNALDALLPWSLRQRLDAEAPTHFEAPTGNRHPIDYESEGAPIVACRVQELFGLESHPSIAGGRLPLTLHLLSPAGRPVQITSDLPGFWKGSWKDVRTDMRGRYPKHVWPEDPAHAQPTARAKPRRT